MTQKPQKLRLFTPAIALAASAMLALSGCANAPTDPNTKTPAGEPIAGGDLTVGIVGGGSKDTLDAHVPVTHPDEARAIQLYDTLATYDTEHRIEMALADEISSSEDGSIWTVRLRDGVQFSDGSPITSDDVIYTYQRITDPESPKAGAAMLESLDRDALKAVDEQTVEFHFTDPFVTFPDATAYYGNGIVPDGYDPDHPVSSGPFMFESFTPGEQSKFVKNPNYWRDGQPYLDSVTIINFPDDTARVNALLGGQVDAIDQLPLGQIKVVEANPELKVLESETGAWIPFTMRVDRAPFDDLRVRQAFRFIVDRQEMIDQVLSGHGKLGNDLYSPFDTCFDNTREQRVQDIDKAKALLAEAGQTGLTVELITTSGAAGMVEAAQVFAEQAKDAGVTVNVRKIDGGEFYGEEYLEWVFAQDFWFTRDFLPQAAQSSLPTAPYNETHFDNAEFNALIQQANKTIDPEARCELIQQAQDIEFEEGGFIIWGFPNSVDAHSSRVEGLVPDKSGIPLTSFGFRKVWFNN